MIVSAHYVLKPQMDIDGTNHDYRLKNPTFFYTYSRGGGPLLQSSGIPLRLRDSVVPRRTFSGYINLDLIMNV